MVERIEHTGVIEKIEGDRVRVRIVQTSGCARCKVAGHCNASESKVKTIDVSGVSHAALLHVGDTVRVSASKSVAFRALLLCFGVPFAVMVAALWITMSFTSDETLGGGVALLSLLPYYGVLYLFRRRIGRGVAFRIDG